MLKTHRGWHNLSSLRVCQSRGDKPHASFLFFWWQLTLVWKGSYTEKVITAQTFGFHMVPWPKRANLWCSQAWQLNKKERNSYCGTEQNPSSLRRWSLYLCFTFVKAFSCGDIFRIFKGANQLRCPLSLWKCQRWAGERPHRVWDGAQLYVPVLQRYLPGAARKQEVARRHGSAKSYNCARLPGPTNTGWPITEGSGKPSQWMHFGKLSISVKIFSYVWTTTFCFLWKLPMKQTLIFGGGKLLWHLSEYQNE